MALSGAAGTRPGIHAGLRVKPRRPTGPFMALSGAAGTRPGIHAGLRVKPRCPTGPFMALSGAAGTRPGIHAGLRGPTSPLSFLQARSRAFSPGFSHLFLAKAANRERNNATLLLPPSPLCPAARRRRRKQAFQRRLDGRLVPLGGFVLDLDVGRFAPPPDTRPRIVVPEEPRQIMLLAQAPHPRHTSPQRGPATRPGPAPARRARRAPAPSRPRDRTYHAGQAPRPPRQPALRNPPLHSA